MHKLIFEISPLPKKILATLADFLIAYLGLIASIFLRTGELPSLNGGVIASGVIAGVLLVLCFQIFEIYLTVQRYFGLQCIKLILRATIIFSLIFTVFLLIFEPKGIPRTTSVILGGWIFIASIFLRAAISGFWGWTQKNKTVSQNIICIYGAGSAGQQALLSLRKNSSYGNVVAYIDDDSSLHGRMIAGLKIYPLSDLENLIAHYGVNNIVLAIPSATRNVRNEILRSLQNYHLQIKSVLDINSYIGKNINRFVPVNLDESDLLQRDVVEPVRSLIENEVFNRTILVTGGGGSIGSELVRQLIAYKPKKIIILDASELAIHNIQMEIYEYQKLHIEFEFILGSILDEKLIFSCISKNGVDIIYHAAAYKHVPLLEKNIVQAVFNNVIGTYYLAKIAQDLFVSKFILISTDKAVRPTNVMGATKRLSEMVLQAFDSECSSTNYSMVRFGNVLGSSGSVVPRFRAQLEAGGPLTLTDERVTRYFMTISEASQLVLQVTGLMKGGEVFLLNMGDPVLIKDLALRLIEQSGRIVRDELNPDGDIEIRIVGLRPGEKLYEELLIGDNPMPTMHPKIMKANESFLPLSQFIAVVNKLEKAVIANNEKEIIDIFETIVSGYRKNLH